MLMLVGCVHQWPEEPAVDPTEVDVHIWVETPDEMTQYPNGASWIDTRRGTFVPAERYDVDTSLYYRRYIVEIRDIQSPQPDQTIRKVFTRSAGDTSAVNLEMSLHAVTYSVVVWQDFVHKPDAKDRYYLTDTLSRIRIQDMPDYVGATDFKDAAYCSQVLDLKSHDGKYFTSKDVTLKLLRPLAKVVFVATDIDKLYYRVKQHYPSMFDVADVFDATETAYAEQRALLAMLTNTVSVSGYFPSGFNAVTGRPNDAVLGYTFQTVPFMVGNRTVIAFDYVFVGENQTSITVNMCLFGPNGEIINTISDRVVPIARNQVTVIEDEFFTKRYTPGIGIDPEFDGEINIRFIKSRLKGNGELFNSKKQ